MKKKAVVYVPVKDTSARTPEQKRMWFRLISPLFEDALSIQMGDYGLKIELAHPNLNVSKFTIVCRYGGIPDTAVKRSALFSWLRSQGECMPTMRIARHSQGFVHTHKT